GDGEPVTQGGGAEDEEWAGGVSSRTEEEGVGEDKSMTEFPRIRMAKDGVIAKGGKALGSKDEEGGEKVGGYGGGGGQVVLEGKQQQRRQGKGLAPGKVLLSTVEDLPEDRGNHRTESYGVAAVGSEVEVVEVEEGQGKEEGMDKQLGRSVVEASRSTLPAPEMAPVTAAPISRTPVSRARQSVAGLSPSLSPSTFPSLSSLVNESHHKPAGSCDEVPSPLSDMSYNKTPPTSREGVTAVGDLTEAVCTLAVTDVTDNPEVTEVAGVADATDSVKSTMGEGGSGGSPPPVDQRDPDSSTMAAAGAAAVNDELNEADPLVSSSTDTPMPKGPTRNATGAGAGAPCGDGGGGDGSDGDGGDDAGITQGGPGGVVITPSGIGKAEAPEERQGNNEKEEEKEKEIEIEIERGGEKAKAREHVRGILEGQEGTARGLFTPSGCPDHGHDDHNDDSRAPQGEHSHHHHEDDHPCRVLSVVDPEDREASLRGQMAQVPTISPDAPPQAQAGGVAPPAGGGEASGSPVSMAVAEAEAGAGVGAGLSQAEDHPTNVDHGPPLQKSGRPRAEVKVGQDSGEGCAMPAPSTLLGGEDVSTPVGGAAAAAIAAGDRKDGVTQELNTSNTSYGELMARRASAGGEGG
ncbi:unnamed protein product, partial [Discosporangium mesarthrocarpum]